MSKLWAWPQYVLAFWMAFTLVAAFAAHGEPRKGSVNAGPVVLFVTLEALILKAGGFW